MRMQQVTRAPLLETRARCGGTRRLATGVRAVRSRDARRHLERARSRAVRQLCVCRRPCRRDDRGMGAGARPRRRGRRPAGSRGRGRARRPPSAVRHGAARPDSRLGQSRRSAPRRARRHARACLARGGPQLRTTALGRLRTRAAMGPPRRRRGRRARAGRRGPWAHRGGPQCDPRRRRRSRVSISSTKRRS